MVATKAAKVQELENNPVIQRFQEYLRIPCVHPNIDYEPCVKFLQKQATEMNLKSHVYYMDPKNPVVVITWPGTDPQKPSVMLNSHMDVVPVVEELWKYPPFGAKIDAEGRIYARGTQDTKGIGMQYLEAIRVLKAAGVTLKRTVHVTFVPDEEQGGHLGMEKFVQTDEFKSMNVGVVMDEGGASPLEFYAVFYAQRSVWRITFHVKGVAGHGSLPAEGTAGEKLRNLLDSIMDFRAEENAKAGGDVTKLGETTTINLTIINGGFEMNVLPSVIDVNFDVRVSPNADHAEFEKKINNMAAKVGGVDVEYVRKAPHVPPTAVDNSNPYWVSLKSAFDEVGLKYKTLILPGGSDSRYLQPLGISSFGFNPINNTPVLAHDHNENISGDTYLKGIKVYETVITKLAST